MHFTFLVVDRGKEMLSIETDANTVVSGTMVKAKEDERARGTADMQDTTLSTAVYD